MGKYVAFPDRYSDMEYKRCGKSGLMLPALSLGMWHNFGKSSDKDEMIKMCTTAFDCGITHFDLANNYGFPDVGSAEENFGEILKKTLMPYRNELVISTKAGYRMWDGPYGDFGSRKYLLSSLDDSLKRMSLDYVDIFYHHRPDKQTPLEETLGALCSAVKSGKALYIGLSNYDGETMKKAALYLKEEKCPFIINQNRFSILDRTIEKNGLLQATQKEEKGLIVFSPLAQGILSDKYLSGIPENSRVRANGIFLKEANITKEVLHKVEKLNELAKKREQTLAQMALSWVLSHDGVTSVLIGASNAKQIKENVRAIKNVSFTTEEMSMIEDIVK